MGETHLGPQRETSNLPGPTVSATDSTESKRWPTT